MHLPHEINVCLQLRQMPFADVGKRRKYVEIVCIRRGKSKVKKVEEGGRGRRRTTTTEATSTTMGSQVELSNRYCFPLPLFNTSHTHSLTLLLLLLLLLVMPLCSLARPPTAPPFPRFCLLFARILFNNLIASHSPLVLAALRCVPKRKKKVLKVRFTSLALPSLPALASASAASGDNNVKHCCCCPTTTTR